MRWFAGGGGFVCVGVWLGGSWCVVCVGWCWGCGCLCGCVCGFGWVCCLCCLLVVFLLGVVVGFVFFGGVGFCVLVCWVLVLLFVFCLVGHGGVVAGGVCGWFCVARGRLGCRSSSHAVLMRRPLLNL
ncbi:hypothetical protein RA276_28080, partial [Pseudomonas syringae pv. tagetis]|uniref:hypothetical protein n=1 Tax=Pseudomonas syringae group genomosp. 7 TaxID=251699 RepID=UPI0037703E9D